MRDDHQQPVAAARSDQWANPVAGVRIYYGRSSGAQLEHDGARCGRGATQVPHVRRHGDKREAVRLAIPA
jgi:hypothetical protein